MSKITDILDSLKTAIEGTAFVENAVIETTHRVVEADPTRAIHETVVTVRVLTDGPIEGLPS